MNQRRPSWDDYFLNIAEQVSTRSTCNRAQVGVVVTDADHFIILTGYNGAPPGKPHCPPDEDLDPARPCRNALHAEQNILMHAARRGVALKSATWYFWPFGPCDYCMRLVQGTSPSGLIVPNNRQFYRRDL